MTNAVTPEPDMALRRRLFAPGACRNGPSWTSPVSARVLDLLRHHRRRPGGPAGLLIAEETVDGKVVLAILGGTPLPVTPRRPPEHAPVPEQDAMALTHRVGGRARQSLGGPTAGGRRSVC
ncbi:hypothetical protein GCM10010430_27000 [Kitasatospora cystarginea]|uniref:Uncharacterized protein n=1 Tax=Kitasatospora cystarginea TaxID=58350 RepID=A0ABP5QWQ7_9ACTN